MGFAIVAACCITCVVINFLLLEWMGYLVDERTLDSLPHNKARDSHGVLRKYALLSTIFDALVWFASHLDLRVSFCATPVYLILGFYAFGQLPIIASLVRAFLNWLVSLLVVTDSVKQAVTLFMWWMGRLLNVSAILRGVGVWVGQFAIPPREMIRMAEGAAPPAEGLGPAPPRYEPVPLADRHPDPAPLAPALAPAPHQVPVFAPGPQQALAQAPAPQQAPAPAPAPRQAPAPQEPRQPQPPLNRQATLWRYHATR